MVVTALDAYFFKGSKVEMERLEENFVTGVWSPPFTDNAILLASCKSAEPPNKRRRQQKTKTTTKGKARVASVVFAVGLHVFSHPPRTRSVEGCLFHVSSPPIQSVIGLGG